MSNFQREHAISNAHVGRDFEEVALNYFEKSNIILYKRAILSIGANQKRKNRVFDLGSTLLNGDKIIVECKSHKWTSSGNVPSGKLTVWNEAMYYFYLAPEEYRKIFFILKDYNDKRGETLGEYYLRTYGHLISVDVEIMEYDDKDCKVRILNSI